MWNSGRGRGLCGGGNRNVTGYGQDNNLQMTGGWKRRGRMKGQWSVEGEGDGGRRFGGGGGGGGKAARW